LIIKKITALKREGDKNWTSVCLSGGKPGFRKNDVVVVPGKKGVLEHGKMKVAKTKKGDSGRNQHCFQTPGGKFPEKIGCSHHGLGKTGKRSTGKRKMIGT